MTSSTDRSRESNARRLYGPYLEAEWGFLNHWYPARFSNEVPENGVVGLQICGIPIVLRRSKGRVYALKDQCVHRGVKLSQRPTCLTPETLTCWYHGFTYDLETGRLVSIAAAPQDKIIGTTGLQVFPVQEVNGLIFVFVTSEDWQGEAPPLAHDLPLPFPENNERFPHPLWPDAPHILHEDAVILGIHRRGYANWRLAVENSFDAGHLLIHKDASYVQAKNWALPLGVRPTSDQAIRLIEDEDGPKGFINMYFTEHWEPVLVNERLNLRASGTGPVKYYRTQIVLPGVLVVESWPEDDVAQYEWFVPITDDTYEYWEVIVRRCKNAEERAAFEYRFDTLYEAQCLYGFNNDDVMAREAMQHFYADGTGWNDEQLGEMDHSIVAWRKLATRHNRGIASKPHGVAGAVRAQACDLVELRGPAPSPARRGSGST